MNFDIWYVITVLQNQKYEGFKKKKKLNTLHKLYRNL